MKTWMVLLCFLISKTVPEQKVERRQLGREILKALRNGFYNRHIDSDEPDADASRPINSIEEAESVKIARQEVPKPKPTPTTEKPNNNGKFANTSTTAKKQKNEEKFPSSKYTNVNFVLYNRGIKFQKQDDSKNIVEKQKYRFNCILVVATSNKCYGWDMGSKGNKTHLHSPDEKKKNHKTKKKKSKRDKSGKEKANRGRISARRQFETIPKLPTYNIYL